MGGYAASFNWSSLAFSRVGNTRYVRFMYQMICPVLERFQAMEGGDASDGAGTGTEIDEVRGGLRAHPSGWLEPGGGGGGSGCLGAHLPALARPLRGGGSRRSLRPPPGPPLGAARGGGRGGAGAGVVRHPLLGLHGQALPREAGGRSRLQAQLQLAAAELASPWAQARGAQAWGAPAQAAAPCPARHDVAPGRLEPRVGPRSMVGPDRHHGRCDQRYLLGLLRRRRGHHVELPGGGPRRSGPRACSARSTPTAPATTGTRPRPAARWTRTPRPRSAAPWRSSASS